MNSYPVGHHDHWEDAYSATCYGSFAELWAEAERYWLGPHAPLNWPVWVEYDEGNEQQWDVGPTVHVGIFMPRHGHCMIWVAPATPEQVAQLRETTLQVWARRADLHFARHTPDPMEIPREGG